MDELNQDFSKGRTIEFNFKFALYCTYVIANNIGVTFNRSSKRVDSEIEFGRNAKSGILIAMRGFD